MHFEWDEQKNLSNFKDHGIDFETSILCWKDPNNFDVLDAKHSSLNQERWLKFGRLPNGEVICVVYSELTENRTRIISSFSDKRVEKIYYEGQHFGR